MRAEKTTYLVRFSLPASLLAALALLAPLPSLAAVTLGQANTTSLSSGLVGYWPLDGATTNWTTGTTMDISGGGTNGTLRNVGTTTAPTAGKAGQALKFNGSNTCILTPAGTLPNFSTAALTVAEWIKTTSAASGMETITQYSSASPGWEMWIPSAGIVDFYIRGATTAHRPIASAINDGKWHLVVGVYSGSTQTMNVYVDGVVSNGALVGTVPASQNAPTSQIEIGAYTTTTNGSCLGFFNGALDDIRIYNRALSATEVALLYASGKANVFGAPQFISGLTGWWDASDANSVKSTSSCTGSVSYGGAVGCIEDKSGQGNNMTQATAGKQPAYLSNGKSGRGVMKFVAASSQTVTTSTNFPAPVTVIYASRQTGGTNGRVLSSVNNNWLLGYWNGSKGQAYFGGWVSSVGGNTSDTIWRTYSAVIPGTGQNSRIYENGTLLFSNQGGVAGPSGLSAVGHAGISEFSNAEIGEILVYNRALSDNERASIERYLATKWGTSYSGSTSGVGYVTVAHSAAGASAPLSSGLVGHWTFDGPNINWKTGTIVDSSGQGNNGTPVSLGTTTSPTIGKIGQALKFNGSTSYVQTTFTPSGYSALSTSVWVKLNSVTNACGGYPIAASYGSNADAVPEMRFSAATGKINWVNRSNNVGPIDSVNVAGTGWHHFVGTANGTTLTLYKDGSLIGSTAQSHNFNGSVPFRFGRRSNDEGCSYPLDGSIDDVRVYNRALSAAEVQQLYKMGK